VNALASVIPGVLTVAQVDRDALAALLWRCGLRLAMTEDGEDIPASYWGAPEAGLVGTVVHARSDTPVHSVLHEACHVLCMDGARRAALVRDAGGDHPEENAVLRLQVLLAMQLADVGAERILADMDRWGYTFRLGSARAWFEVESGDAAEWLRVHGLVGDDGSPTLRWRA
jgi:hypothetical protein